MAYQAYIEPQSESYKLLNTKNCAEIVANAKYIWKLFGVRYGINAKDVTKPKTW